MYLVSKLDLEDRVALVEPSDPGYATVAREITSIEVGRELASGQLGRGHDLLR